MIILPILPGFICSIMTKWLLLLCEQIVNDLIQEDHICC